MEATVACVLRSGGVFTPEWVWRLRAQCHRHLPPHHFRCLSDLDVPGRVVMTEHYPGWWSKLELFKPNVLTGRIVYLDLDTILVGDASALFGYLGPFASLSDFYRPEMPASGLWAWDASLNAEIWENIQRDPPPLNNRRSDFYWPRVTPRPERLQDLFPGLIGSYKADQLQDGPKDYSVVCFHGEPKQPDAAPWVREVWR